MDLMQAIRERRSIRKYKPDPLSEEQVNAVLEAARWAPSWANTQCWRFVVVRDPEVKGALAETCRPGNPAIPALQDAPVVIVACAELGHSGYKAGEVMTSKGDWFMFDVALAMANLTLAAHSLGLGTVHVGLFNAEEAEKVLGTPPGVTVVEMTPLGYPDQDGRVPRRKELSEIIFYEAYGRQGESAPPPPQP